MNATCRHCGAPLTASAAGDAAGAAGFCCQGCAAAFEMVSDLGLESWYQRRVLRDGVRPPKPEEFTAIDPAAYVQVEADGSRVLHLMVEGLHCAACVWLIESVLSRQPGVVSARLNMTTRRLVLRYRPDQTQAAALIATVAALGYRLVPFDPCRLGRAAQAEERELLRSLAVAGFAAANVMLLSVSVWAGALGEMGPATRDLLHWMSALIALPAVAYAGQPFFRSALRALGARRLNMDVPISLGVILAAGISLFETWRGGPDAYFDAAATLLFFLLIGRYLDRRARSKARSAGEHLLALNAVAATVVGTDGKRRSLPVSQVRVGDHVEVLPGDRIPVDARVTTGASDIDMSLISGESLPQPVTAGGRVFAGTLNLSGPLGLEVTAAAQDTLLAEIVRLMEASEQGRARYVQVADRVARLYAPVVHVLAASTFVGWMVLGAGWEAALLTAIATLIVTCPCALGLAVPTVQIVASGSLLRRGVLVKAADALERLAVVDHVVFDKTGTLTLGRLDLLPDTGVAPDDLALAASLASASRHPLSRALVRARPAGDPSVEAFPIAVSQVREVPGAGLEATVDGRLARLGSRRFCGLAEVAEGQAEAVVQAGPELWLAVEGRVPVRFAFQDRPRIDAAATVAALKARGLGVSLLSGDRAAVAGPLAAELGIADWRADLTPKGKTEALAALAAEGRRVLMVGDGLNDAPALAAAFVSFSPSTAADISQTAADLVFQGDLLRPVALALAVARKADRVVKQNFALALGYNAVAVPLAVAGLVNPLIAAAAMSSSSIAVSLNALRLRRVPMSGAEEKRKAGGDARTAVPGNSKLGFRPDSQTTREAV